MAKKGPRQLVTLECTSCKERNYSTTKSTRNTPDRMELKKFCRKERAKTVHKETK